MFLGTNLQYLRRQQPGMTQEKLAQQMGVSRQTISKWESGEALPEISNLMELAEIFSCKLDDLLRRDLSALPGSSVKLVNLAPFRYVQYIMISANARQDVRSYMERWAGENGVDDRDGYIHWGFPYVSAEQKKRFTLQGHAAAWILPDDFAPSQDGLELHIQGQATYARMSVPADVPSAQAYMKIMEYLGAAGVAKSAAEGFLPCFEREYRKDGAVYKEVYVLCENQETDETVNLKE